MRNKIKDILENNYYPTGLDMQKATDELLNLFGVSNNAVAVCACGKFIELVDNTQCKKCQAESSEAKAN